MDMMNGTDHAMSAPMMIAMGILYILVLAVVVLGIMALWKYIKSK